MSDRWAPIQGSGDHARRYQAAKTPYGYVPWDVAKRAYDQYARQYGNDQSFETLNSRGGFDWDELNWLLGDERTLGPLKAAPVTAART